MATNDQEGRGAVATACLATATAVCILARWLSSVAPLGYLGWDSYPILLTSRVTSWSDLGGLLGGRLMADFYPGAFYRPVLSLSVAIEQAFGGPHPAVSACVNVALLAATALLLFRLLRRLIPATPWAAAAGSTLLLLHPACGTVVPYLARRPDLLSALLLVWMLDVEASTKGPSGRRRIAALLLALAAMGSKETGLAAPLLVAALAVVSTAGGWRSRVAAAVRRATPHAGVALGYLALRTTVLGGLGGHGRRGELADLPLRLEQLVAASLSAAGVTVAHWLAFALALALAVVTLGRAGRLAGRSSGDGLAATFTLGVAWLAALALVLTPAGRFSPWYAFGAVMPLCLLVAAGIGMVAHGLRTRGGDRALAWAGALAWLVVAAAALGGSPVLTANPEWERARAERSAFLARLEGELRGARAGDVIRMGDYPSVVRPRDARQGQRQIAVLAPYSIRAWAMLQHPELEVRVARRRELGVEPPRGDQVTVEVRRAAKIPVDAPPLEAHSR
jgi:hypothetical protein